MKTFFTYQLNEFDEITHDGEGILNQSERLSSFIGQVFGSDIQKQIAKPVIKGNAVSWKSSSKKEFKRITDLNEVKRNIAIEKYWKLRQSIELKIEEFEATDQVEKKDWAVILKKSFNQNNNIVFSDEDADDILIVWGSNFKKQNEIPKSEKYIEFENRNIATPIVIPNDESQINEENSNNFEDQIEHEESSIEHKSDHSIVNKKRKKYTFWQKCDRSITWFCFRYWWLALLLIIGVLILLIFCLNGYFDKKHKCNFEDDLNDRITYIENNLDNCCDCYEEKIEVDYENEYEIRDSTHFSADYLVITYQFDQNGGKDLDTRTQIIRPEISEKLGCGFPENNKNDAINWSGDNTNYGVESCWIDLTKFKENEKVFIACSAFWYSIKNNGNMSLDIRAFEGGEMNKNGYQFYNTGGAETGFISYSKNISLLKNSCKIEGEDVGIIEYNKGTKELFFLEK